MSLYSRVTHCHVVVVSVTKQTKEEGRCLYRRFIQSLNDVIVMVGTETVKMAEIETNSPMALQYQAEHELDLSAAHIHGQWAV